MIHLPKPLYRHRLYGHNASRDIPSERALLGRQRFLEKHRPACEKGSQEAKALKRDWAQYYGDLGKYYLMQRRAKDARQAFWQSLKQDPLKYKTVLRWLRSFV